MHDLEIIGSVHIRLDFCNIKRSRAARSFDAVVGQSRVQEFVKWLKIAIK